MKTLTFTFLFLPAFVAQSQIISGCGVKFGVVASKQLFDEGNEKHPVLSNIYGNMKSRIGPQLGLFVNFPSFSHLMIQTEINYLEKGAKVRYPVIPPENPQGKVEFVELDHFHNDYLALSFLAQPRMKWESASLYGIIGPSLNFLLASRGAIHPRGAKSITPSLIIGAGFAALKLFDFPLLFEVRYNPDLAYFQKTEYVRLKHRVVQFILGVELK